MVTGISRLTLASLRSTLAAIGTHFEAGTLREGRDSVSLVDTRREKPVQYKHNRLLKMAYCTNHMYGIVLNWVMSILARSYLYFEKASEALVPPKPKLFDNATLTSFCCADNGT
jgi:hypothetical protein